MPSLQATVTPHTASESMTGDELESLLRDTADNENRQIKQYRVLCHLQGESSDWDLVKNDVCSSALELNDCYKHLQFEEECICQVIAIKSLHALNEYLYFQNMPSAVRLQAEGLGVTIFQIFSPYFSDWFKEDLLSYLPKRLQLLAHIMGFISHIFDTGKYTCDPEETYANICKSTAKMLVTKRFKLGTQLEDLVFEFIDSEPKYKGVSIFCEGDDETLAGIRQAKWRIQQFEDRLRATKKATVNGLIRRWESDRIVTEEHNE